MGFAACLHGLSRVLSSWRWFSISSYRLKQPVPVISRSIVTPWIWLSALGNLDLPCMDTISNAIMVHDALLLLLQVGNPKAK